MGLQGEDHYWASITEGKKLMKLKFLYYFLIGTSI